MNVEECTYNKIFAVSTHNFLTPIKSAITRKKVNAFKIELCQKPKKKLNNSYLVISVIRHLNSLVIFILINFFKKDHLLFVHSFSIIILIIHHPQV